MISRWLQTCCLRGALLARADASARWEVAAERRGNELDSLASHCSLLTLEQCREERSRQERERVHLQFHLTSERAAAKHNASAYFLSDQSEGGGRFRAAGTRRDESETVSQPASQLQPTRHRHQFACSPAVCVCSAPARRVGEFDVTVAVPVVVVGGDARAVIWCRALPLAAGSSVWLFWPNQLET